MNPPYPFRTWEDYNEFQKEKSIVRQQMHFLMAEQHLYEQALDAHRRGAKDAPDIGYFVDENKPVKRTQDEIEAYLRDPSTTLRRQITLVQLPDNRPVRPVPIKNENLDQVGIYYTKDPPSRGYVTQVPQDQIGQVTKVSPWTGDKVENEFEFAKGWDSTETWSAVVLGGVGIGILILIYGVYYKILSK